MAGLSLVHYNVTAFFSTVLNNAPFIPVFTKQHKIVESLINAEPKPDTELLKRINDIYQTTHKKVNLKLPTTELIVFKNLDKGLNREVDINGKTFHLIQLYEYLDEVSLEFSRIVTGIAKKYNIDIPFNFGKQTTGGIVLE